MLGWPGRHGGECCEPQGHGMAQGSSMGSRLQGRSTGNGVSSGPHGRAAPTLVLLGKTCPPLLGPGRVTPPALWQGRSQTQHCPPSIWGPPLEEFNCACDLTVSSCHGDSCEDTHKGDQGAGSVQITGRSPWTVPGTRYHCHEICTFSALPDLPNPTPLLTLHQLPSTL